MPKISPSYLEKRPYTAAVVALCAGWLSAAWDDAIEINAGGVHIPRNEGELMSLGTILLIILIILLLGGISGIGGVASTAPATMAVADWGS